MLLRSILPSVSSVYSQPSPISSERDRLNTDSDLTLDSQKPVTPQNVNAMPLTLSSPPATNVILLPQAAHPSSVPMDTSVTSEPLSTTAPVYCDEVNRSVDKSRRGRRYNHGRKQGSHHKSVRKQSERKSWTWPSSRSTKTISLALSLIVLLVILTVYLSIALTHDVVRQEVHVIFIFLILCAIIFVAHSVIRLCLYMFLRRSWNSTAQEQAPNKTRRGKAMAPRFYSAGDEDIEAGRQAEDGGVEGQREMAASAPPPAYGLWRSSIRLDPNPVNSRLAQPVNYDSHTPRYSASPIASTCTVNSPTCNMVTFSVNTESEATREADTMQPRPPSYESDEQVTNTFQSVPLHVESVEDQHDAGDRVLHPAYR